jgi:L-serine deaminase
VTTSTVSPTTVTTATADMPTGQQLRVLLAERESLEAQKQEIETALRTVWQHIADVATTPTITPGVTAPAGATTSAAQRNQEMTAA